MGKNNNGFVYLRLMQMYVATTQYCIYHSVLLTLTFMADLDTVLFYVFDPPMQNTIVAVIRYASTLIWF